MPTVRRLRPAIAYAGALLAISAVVSAEATAYDVEVGKPHPDFVLPRIDTRDPVALSDFRGKKVLLIHFASW